MASRAANRRERAAQREEIAKAAQAPETQPELTPEQVELEKVRQAHAQAEAQRAAAELKVVLEKITKHLGTETREGLPTWAAWTAYSHEVRLHHRTELCWGLKAEARLAIEERFGAPFAATADINIASTSGSPAEVLASLALHREVAEKTAQAQMMLAAWLGRRPQEQVKAAFAIIARELQVIVEDYRAARDA